MSARTREAPRRRVSRAGGSRSGQRRIRLLISAGPTREPIDSVRFISNYSTGYMGAQLVHEALARGHRVTVVSGPVTEPFPEHAQVIPVLDARQMEQALRRQAPRADVVIMAAAVADFRPIRPLAGKRHRQGPWTLTLEPTPDIISRLPRHAHQLRVGFAVEAERVLLHATRKLREKRLDLLLAQQLSASAPSRGALVRRGAEERSPFGRHRIRAWLCEQAGSIDLGMLTKRAAARLLLDKIETLWYGQRSMGG